MEYLASIKSVLSSIFFSLAILSGGSYTQPVTINNPIEKVTETVREVPQLGSTISAAADFSTSLSSAITSSATSMTLVSLTSGSETLTSGGLYGFKLGGREYVLGYISTSTANTIVYMTRGVSRKTGTTTVSAYQSAWGRGTSVEITDAPLLLDLTNKANGTVGYEQPLQYASSVATTTIDDDNRNLVNYELLAYTAFNGAGVVNTSATQKGVSQLATTLQTASSTATGSTAAPLVIPASNATSTYNSATAPLRVVVTQNNGKIDSNFIATSSLGLTNNSTLTGTTTILAIASTTGSGVFGINPWSQIGESTLGAAATSITVGPFPLRKDLMIKVSIPGKSTNSGITNLIFNGDTGHNYSYDVYSMSGSTIASSAASSNTSFALADAGSTPFYGEGYKIEVNNYQNNVAKNVFSTGLAHVSGGSGSYEGGGYAEMSRGSYFATSTQIYSVTVQTGSAATFNIGSRVTVYASNE